MSIFNNNTPRGRFLNMSLVAILGATVAACSPSPSLPPPSQPGAAAPAAGAATTLERMLKGDASVKYPVFQKDPWPIPSADAEMVPGGTKVDIVSIVNTYFPHEQVNSPKIVGDPAYSGPDSVIQFAHIKYVAADGTPKTGFVARNMIEGDMNGVKTYSYSLGDRLSTLAPVTNLNLQSGAIFMPADGSAPKSLAVGEQIGILYETNSNTYAVRLSDSTNGTIVKSALPKAQRNALPHMLRHIQDGVLAEAPIDSGLVAQLIVQSKANAIENYYAHNEIKLPNGIIRKTNMWGVMNNGIAYLLMENIENGSVTFQHGFGILPIETHAAGGLTYNTRNVLVESLARASTGRPSNGAVPLNQYPIEFWSTDGTFIQVIPAADAQAMGAASHNGTFSPTIIDGYFKEPNSGFLSGGFLKPNVGELTCNIAALLAVPVLTTAIRAYANGGNLEEAAAFALGLESIPGGPYSVQDGATYILHGDINSNIIRGREWQAQNPGKAKVKGVYTTIGGGPLVGFTIDYMDDNKGDIASADMYLLRPVMDGFYKLGGDDPEDRYSDSSGWLPFTNPICIGAGDKVHFRFNDTGIEDYQITTVEGMPGRRNLATYHNLKPGNITQITQSERLGNDLYNATEVL